MSSEKSSYDGRNFREGCKTANLLLILIFTVCALCEMKSIVNSFFVQEVDAKDQYGSKNIKFMFPRNKDFVIVSYIKNNEEKSCILHIENHSVNNIELCKFN